MSAGFDLQTWRYLFSKSPVVGLFWHDGFKFSCCHQAPIWLSIYSYEGPAWLSVAKQRTRYAIFECFFHHLSPLLKWFFIQGAELLTQINNSTIW